MQETDITPTHGRVTGDYLFYHHPRYGLDYYLLAVLPQLGWFYTSDYRLVGISFTVVLQTIAYSGTFVDYYSVIGTLVLFLPPPLPYSPFLPSWALLFSGPSQPYRPQFTDGLIGLLF